MAARRGPKNVTAAHKAAMAAGRNESRTVAAYLEALQAHRPRRGRRRTPASIEARLEVIASELDEADLLTRLHLVQERMNLEAELDALTTNDGAELEALEEAFVDIAANYANRKAITYNAWRTVGVPAAVLRQAGIPR